LPCEHVATGEGGWSTLHVAVGFCHGGTLFILRLYVMMNERRKYKAISMFYFIHIPCIFYYFVLWPTNAQFDGHGTVHRDIFL